MPFIERHHRALFLLLFAVFIIFGMSMTIIGATLPVILTDFQWNYLIAGFVLGAGAIAYFVATFVGGYLVQHWGAKPTLLLGLVLDVVGLSFFATTPEPLTNILLSALIGIGQGAIEITINWSTLRIDEKNSGRPMNLMHGAFAIGAILGPMAVGALIHSGLGWTIVFRGMAAIFVLLAIIMVFTPLPFAAHAAEKQSASAERLSKHPAYWLSFFALLVYVGVELGISNWVAEYFVAVFSYSPAASAFLVSLFWAGLLAGRFGVPLFYAGPRQDAVLIGFSALAAVAVILLTVLGYVGRQPLTIEIGRALVFFAGLGCSIYYPAVITLLGKCFPHAQSQAIGFAATGGGIGAFAFPFLMSALSQTWGIRAGFATYGVFAIVMTLCAIGLAISVVKTNTRSSANTPH